MNLPIYLLTDSYALFKELATTGIEDLLGNISVIWSCKTNFRQKNAPDIPRHFQTEYKLIRLYFVCSKWML